MANSNGGVARIAERRHFLSELSPLLNSLDPGHAVAVGTGAVAHFPWPAASHAYAAASSTGWGNYSCGWVSWPTTASESGTAFIECAAVMHGSGYSRARC